MRKFNRFNYSPLFPRISSSSTQSNGSIRVSELRNQSQVHSTIQKYQRQIQNREKRATIAFKVNKRYSKIKTTARGQFQRSQVVCNLNQISKDVVDLRNQLKNKRHTRNTSFTQKIERLATEMINLHKNRSEVRQSVHQPLYYPVPMPFPIYLTPQLPPEEFKSKLFKNQTLYEGKTKSKHRFFGAIRVKMNIKRWKKIFNCILFIIYLKRFCRLAQSSRKIAFARFINNKKSQVSLIRKGIIRAIRPFLDIILEKKEVCFDLLEEDSRSIIKEKVSSIRKLTGLIIQNLLQYLIKNGNTPECLSSLYHLCRHGNYSCTEPLLTREELEISCVSPAFGYISADKNLEKVNFINLIFIKLLIFNTLLSNDRLGRKFQGDDIQTNLYVVSSVIYELISDIQDEFLLQVPAEYKMGNYQSIGNIRVLQSIVVKNGQILEGELISGLKDERWVRKYFEFEEWMEQKRNVKQLLEIMHKMVKQYHIKLIKAYF